MSFVFAPAPVISVPVSGSDLRFPVHRIYCVGKNYAAHIREMGADLRKPPCFFMKPTDAVVLDGKVPYPPGTRNFHYEGELVLALGKGGSSIAPEHAAEHIFGYAAGLDMTRRDLQTLAGHSGEPWDTGKGFDHSAPLSALMPIQSCGRLDKGSLRLWVNEVLKQDADIADLIWKSHEIISHLSRLYTLQAGDLIFTGTPAGVGPVEAGDRIRLAIEGVGELQVQIIAG